IVAAYPSLLLPAHGAAQLTRYLSFASGTRPSAPCSPWSGVFPPCPPPVTNFHPCSGTSQVVHPCPTPYQRSCRDCGSSPSSTGPPTASCRALVGSPGSRAWRFHACRRSLTSQVLHRTALSSAPPTPVYPGANLFISQSEHGIDARGAARGKPGSKQRDRDQQK